VEDRRVNPEAAAEETLTHLIDIVQAAAPLAAELREQATLVGLALATDHRGDIAGLEEKAFQLEAVLARAVGLLWRYRTQRSPELAHPTPTRARRRDDRLAGMLMIPSEQRSPRE
jgi:hypothetical protein